MIWYQRPDKNGMAIIINTRIKIFSISTSLKNVVDNIKAASKTTDVTRSISNLNSNTSSPELKISKTKDQVDTTDSKVNLET